MPSCVWWDYIDGFITVDDKSAYDATLELVRKEAIFVGSSGGAAAAGARQLAETLPESSLVVTLLPDSGERYLSKLNRHWLKEKGLIASEEDF
jgi:cysteine synthase